MEKGPPTGGWLGNFRPSVELNIRKDSRQMVFLGSPTLGWHSCHEIHDIFCCHSDQIDFSARKFTHCFATVAMVINLIVGVYIPMIRIHY